jgi:hypothetical protein
VVKRRVNRRGEGHEKERITAARRPRYDLGGKIGASARSIVDDNLLAEPFRLCLSDQARQDVR